MSRVIVLDTFPLSSTAKRDADPEAPVGLLDECQQWIAERISAGCRIIVPSICYYEVPRELERRQAAFQISRLREFCRAASDRYVSLTDAHLDLAAKLWARARMSGRPTAGTESLDADVILCAQVLQLGLDATTFVVATTNPGHLSQFVPCDLWQNILD